MEGLRGSLWRGIPQPHQVILPITILHISTIIHNLTGCPLVGGQTLAVTCDLVMQMFIVAAENTAVLAQVHIRSIHLCGTIRQLLIEWEAIHKVLIS